MSSFRVLNQRICLLDDADLIKQVLVTDQAMYTRDNGATMLRELVGDGPSRKFRCRPQAAAKRDVVELDDDAVSVERESARAGHAFLPPLAAVLGNLVDPFQRLPMGLDRQPQACWSRAAGG